MVSPWLSIVAPVYNEEGCIEEFYRRVAKILDQYRDKSSEFIFINDGSTDRSMEILQRLRKTDARIKIIHFTRNFGHQGAIKAGIDFAAGEALVIMDTDLQDTPEVIPQFIEKWHEGYDVVYAIRHKREGKNWLKKLAYVTYYRLIKHISDLNMPVNVGDFRLMTKPVADAFRKLKERNLYIRGLVTWVGFRQIGIELHRPKRKTGETKYTWGRLFQLGWNGITHFSNFPLHLSTYMGVGSLAITFFTLSYVLLSMGLLGKTYSNSVWIVLVILFFSSIQLLSLGIIGSYLARNFDEARHRPLYLVKTKEGF